MGKNNIEFDFSEMEYLMKEVEEAGSKGEQAVRYTLKDLRSRVPGWVAKEVSTEYNISQGEVKGKTKEDVKRAAVSVSVTGNTIGTLAVIYRGHALSPYRFSMSPKMPGRTKLKKKRIVPGGNINFNGPAGKYATLPVFKKYSIGYTIKKGRKMKLNGKYDNTPFLAPVTEGSSLYIPFERKSEDRKDIEATKTVSVPQMVSSKNVSEDIYSKLETEAQKRLEHHLDRLL